MDARERAAREDGAIKVFLRSEDIGVVMGALTWMKVGMATADALRNRLEDNEMANELPDELFRHMDPAIDGARENLITQAVSDSEDQEGSQGPEALWQTVQSIESDVELIQKAATAVQRELYRTLIVSELQKAQGDSTGQNPGQQN